MSFFRKRNTKTAKIQTMLSIPPVSTMLGGLPTPEATKEKIRIAVKKGFKKEIHKALLIKAG